MRIIAMGIDIIAHARMQCIYQRYQDKFLKRYFTRYECQQIQAARDPLITMAGYFAGKEAFFKAVSDISFILPSNLEWKKIEIGKNYNSKHISLNQILNTTPISVGGEQAENLFPNHLLFYFSGDANDHYSVFFVLCVTKKKNEHYSLSI